MVAEARVEDIGRVLSTPGADGDVYYGTACGGRVCGEVECAEHVQLRSSQSVAAYMQSCSSREVVHEDDCGVAEARAVDASRRRQLAVAGCSVAGVYEGR